MLIDFINMEETIVPHSRGGEKDTIMRRFTDELGNRIMTMKLVPGASIGYHMHEDESEIMYILKGSGKMLYDGGYEILTAGQGHLCPKGHSHGFINNTDEDLEFFAVVAKQ